MNELEYKVLQWAKEKGIIDNSDAQSQSLKFLSEVGELADAVLKDDIDDVKDAIGDTWVTMILLAELADVKWVAPNTDFADFDFLDARGAAKGFAYNVCIYAGLVLSSLKISKDTAIMLDITFGQLEWVATCYDTTPIECLQIAYDIINKRTGKMKNGAFVKDEK